MIRRVLIAVVVLLFLLPLVLIDWPATNEWLMYSRPEELSYGFEVRHPRLSWWPGPGLIVTPQACPRCRAGDHDRCANQTGELVLAPLPTPTGRTPLGQPRDLQIHFAGSVTVEGAEVRCKEVTIEGVEITPETFTCDCCE